MFLVGNGVAFKNKNMLQGHLYSSWLYDKGNNMVSN